MRKAVHGGFGQQERGLVLLIAAGLLVGGAVLLWPSRLPASRSSSGPIVYEDVLIVAPTFRTAGKVDVNTASAQELTRLPGVGDVLASRIIAFRESNGPFAALDDLTGVSGIGPQTVERLREFATTAGADEAQAWTESQ